MDTRLEKLLLKVQNVNESMDISTLDLFKELIGLYDRIYEIRLRNKNLSRFSDISTKRYAALTILKLIEISQLIYLELKDRKLNLKPLRGELIRLGRIKEQAEFFPQREKSQPLRQSPLPLFGCIAISPTIMKKKR